MRAGLHVAWVLLPFGGGEGRIALNAPFSSKLLQPAKKPRRHTEAPGKSDREVQT